MVTTRAEGEMIRRFLRDTTGLILHLFVNKIEPEPGDQVSKYQEASGGGYTPITLRAAAWKFETAKTGDVVAVYPEVAFEFTGHVGFVYGYYVTESTGWLVAAERFAQPDDLLDEPFDVHRSGDQIKVSLVFGSKGVTA